MKNLTLFLPALLLSSSAATAQHELLQIEDPSFPSSTFSLIGVGAGFAGDLNLDGFEDFVVTAYAGFQPRILAYSGRTGALLWVHEDPSGIAKPGAAGVASIGRIDGDSVPDIILSTSSDYGSNPAWVSSHRVLSGATGGVLYDGNLNPGSVSIPSAAGDIDGDAFGDYLLTYPNIPFGAPAQLANGRVYIMSGATHQPIRSHGGDPNYFTFNAKTLGDLNGDGRDEYVILQGCEDLFCNPSYEVRSGIDGAILFTRAGAVPVLGSLQRVIPIGDFDGDGAPDFHWFLSGMPLPGENTETYENRFISGATGLSVGEFLTSSPFQFIAGSMMSDLNGDGRDELLVSDEGPFGQNGLYILDPATQTSSWTALSDGARRLYLTPSSSYLGDLNADGAPDILASVLEYSPTGSSIRVPSRLVVISGARVSPSEIFCAGDGGTSPGCTECPCSYSTGFSVSSGCRNSEGFGATLRVRGEVSLTNDHTEFELNRGPANSFALLASANRMLPQQGPCAPGSGVTGPLTDGLRCIGGDFRRHGVRAIDAMGSVGLFNPGWGGSSGTTGSLLSQSGALLGQERYFQVLYRDDVTAGCGTGVNTTNAIRVEPLP